MATVTATATTTPPPAQVSYYGHPSPAHSTTSSPIHHSPTSSLNPLPLQSRQLRPPKGPLYVPAALRPTERPTKSSPPTPPRSAHNSPDRLNGDNGYPASRRSTVESKGSGSGISKLAEDEWMKNEQLGEVTGLPTREHWKADSASPNCDSPTCRSSFGLFLRRHHCRHCGHVFCSSHTPYLVPLDQDARFHPEGALSRACDLCWSAYQRWEETRGTRLSKIQSELERNQDASSQHSDSSETSSQEQPALRPGLPQNSEIAASVPRDWNWSTF